MCEEYGVLFGFRKGGKANKNLDDLKSVWKYERLRVLSV